MSKKPEAPENHVLMLLEKASRELSPTAAMQYSQAALNAANALATLSGTKKSSS